VAVLFVLGSHLSNADLHLFPTLSLSGIGKVGVWLFFVLSSFLLTLQFLARQDESLMSVRLWLYYFLRRFFCIYPLFTFVMFITWALSDSGYFVMGGTKDLVTRLALQDAKGVEWSILVEFRYYLLLPIIVLVMTFLLHRRFLHVTLATLTAVVLVDLTRPPIDLFSLRLYVGIFIIGSFTAYLYQLSQHRPLGLIGSPLVKWSCEITAAGIAMLIF
jgi:peptidoglycan/LPS O-acetylase OafA/YrhL